MDISELSKSLGGASENKRILITGASGWIGRETIAKLRLLIPNEFAQRVTLAGSRASTINVAGETHRIEKLTDLRADERWDVVIHLAFLSQEKVNHHGPTEYSRLNRQLSMFVHDLCLNANCEYVLVASSGAANPNIFSNQTDPAKRLYGELKRESEELFMNLQKEANATVEICRIWSISGAHIQEPRKYAIGDFISQVRNSGNIELRNPGVVTRAYVDGGQLMEVLLLNLLSGQSEILDSGGFIVTLQELAKLVLAELNPTGRLILPEILEPQHADFYVPQVSRFNKLSKKAGITLSSLKNQIRATAESDSFLKINQY